MQAVLSSGNDTRDTQSEGDKTYMIRMEASKDQMDF